MTMQKLGAVRRALAAGELDGAMTRLLYGDLTEARRRVSELLDGFQHTFGAGEDTLVALCSAPGRTEIGGNHTDHQHGRVLAGAVDLDFLACAAPNGTNTIRFQSQGCLLYTSYPAGRGWRKLYRAVLRGVGGPPGGEVSAWLQFFCLGKGHFGAVGKPCLLYTSRCV